MFSKYYYSSVANNIREGIGLLPIKVFSHYEYGDENLHKYILLEELK